MAGVPYIGPILERISTNITIALIPGIESNDTALYKNTTLAFGDTLFFHPSTVPFNTRMAWLGAGLLIPPIVTSLVLERTQDPEKLFDAGRNGLPLLCMSGVEDAERVSGNAVVDEMKPYFKNLEAVSFEDAGHAFFYQQPEETNRALLQFTRKVSGQFQ